MLSAYGNPGSLAALIVRADGGRRKWWRRWRCPVVCVCTLCNGLLPCGSGGCKSGGCKSGGQSGGKSGGKSGKSGGKSGGCKSCKRSNLFSGCLCALHVVQWPPALQGRYTRPPFNGAAAVKRLSASVSGGVFLRGSKREQKYCGIAIFRNYMFLHQCCRYGVGIG